MAGEEHESHTAAANIIDAAPQGYVEYEIDIERVLRTDLPGVLDEMEIAPLTPDAVDAIPAGAKGAYVLFENGHPVYAGKTDTRHGFRDRLNRHAFTIQHRHNLDPSTIGFKAIRIMVFSNFDVEAILIAVMRSTDPTALLWNTSGFGSNDPGRNREAQEPAQFDTERPIDIDRPLDFIAPGEHETMPLMLSLKQHLPYIFRWQIDRGGYWRRGHVDFREAPTVTVPADAPPTMRSILRQILAGAPAGWQATIFPDRVILYKEAKQYEFAREALTR